MTICNPFGLAVRTIAAGRDYVLLVTGGEAHIGAAAVAYPAATGGVSTEIISLPGHKEAELARELAGLACRRLGRTVTVIAGIHIDRATSEEIHMIVLQTRKLVREELDILAGRQEEETWESG